jgi:hypothetical protein
VTNQPRKTGSSLHWLIASVFVIGSIAAIVWLERPYKFDVDSRWYVDIAEGRMRDVIKPFANRALVPLLSGLLARTLHVGTDTAFLILGTLSLSVFVCSITLIARAYIPILAIVALQISPFMTSMLRDYYLPDVFHAGVLGAFFVCLLKERFWLSIALLCLANVTRESTIILTLVVVALSTHRRQWAIAAAAIVATALGASIAGYAARFSQPNIHHIGDLAYILLKVPFNFMKNLFGLVLWTNTLAANMPEAFPRDPQWMVSVPAWLPSGSIHSVGFYEFNPWYPVLTLIVLLSTFGVVPTFVLSDLRNSASRRSLLRDAPFWVLVALIYGLFSFVLGTSIGASIDRLVGYGWPCFFIAFPFMLARDNLADNKLLNRFVATSFAACWVPCLFREMSSIGTAVAVIGALLLLHALAWREINRALRHG